MGPLLQIQPKLTCPNCWKSLDPADLLWVSSHPDLRGDAFLGEDALKRFLPSRFDVDGFALDAKGTRCHTLACPSCHLAVPRILTEMRPIVVSVFGSPSSGKSYFIAASVWEMRKKMHAFNVTFTDADPVSNQIISGYEEQLFLSSQPDQLTVIDKTQEEGELYQSVNYGDRTEMYGRPFVFSMRPTQSHVHLGRTDDIRTGSRALCLYDNAGEHFVATHVAELSPATDHLALSDALIFVLDLLQHTRFRALCRKHSSDPQLEAERENEKYPFRQDIILLEAAKRIRQKANMAAHEKFTRPLIVAVNKYDTWGPLIPNLDLSSIFPYEKMRDGTIVLNYTMLKNVSQRITGLLRQHAPEVLAACDSFSEDVLFVPTSPQGCPPKTSAGNILGVLPENIQPVWAEVPLLYAISRSKAALIPSTQLSQKTENSESTKPESSDDQSPHIFRGSA